LCSLGLALSSASVTGFQPCSVSISRSSNRTCGFPASGSRTRRHADAHEKGCPALAKSDDAHLSVQVVRRETGIAPIADRVLRAPPLADPLEDIVIDVLQGLGDRADLEVVRPADQEAVQRDAHRFRRLPQPLTTGLRVDSLAQPAQRFGRRLHSQIGRSCPRRPEPPERTSPGSRTSPPAGDRAASCRG